MSHAPTQAGAALVKSAEVAHRLFMFETTIDTPTGPMILREKDGAIVRAEWGVGASDDTP